MINVKSLFDAVEKGDGERVWVESHGLTRDLQEWCKVDHVATQFGPPVELARWFEDHPDGYDYFRATYHASLAKSPYLAQLQAVAAAGLKRDITLLHQAEDPNRNTASALHEFLTELQIYCPPDISTED